MAALVHPAETDVAPIFRNNQVTVDNGDCRDSGPPVIGPAPGSSQTPSFPRGGVPGKPGVVQGQRSRVRRASGDPSFSYMKTRRVAITKGDRTCYAQIQDAGPGQYNDAEHVFGTDNERA